MKSLLSENMFVKRMKVALGLVPSAMMVLSSCTQPTANFTGTISGVESDTLLVFVDHMNERKTIMKDTVALTNNHFELQIPDSAACIRFMPKPSSPNAPLRMFQGMPILFFPGDALTIEGSIDNYKVTGSELYDGLAKYAEIAKMEEQINLLNQDFSKAYAAKDETEKNRIKKEVGEAYEKLQGAKFAVVKQDPSSIVAAYFSMQLKPEKGLEAIKLIDGKVKNPSMEIQVQKAKSRYEQSVMREKAKLSVKAGNISPDFKFTTLDGKEVSLDSFKGKYLLVDFWGTWCGWCVKGIPAMKEAYEKHKNKVEFLGICCGDTEDKWRKAVAHYQLPWVNVLEGETKASARFAVAGYPTKILIGPDGKIIEVFVGETPELYKRLDRI